jgi:WD40 repeat protein
LVCATGPAAAASSSADDEDAEAKSAVEAVLFSPADPNQLITGTLEGAITVWDVSTHVSRKTKTIFF